MWVVEADGSDAEDGHKSEISGEMWLGYNNGNWKKCRELVGDPSGSDGAKFPTKAWEWFKHDAFSVQFSSIEGNTIEYSAENMWEIDQPSDADDRIANMRKTIAFANICAKKRNGEEHPRYEFEDTSSYADKVNHAIEFTLEE